MSDDVVERVARAIFEAGGYPVDAVPFESHRLRKEFMFCAKAALAVLEQGDFIGDLVLMSGPAIANLEREAAEQMRERAASLAEERITEGSANILANLAAAIRVLEIEG